MGTRHLVCVQRGGEIVVAQYGQWDGYPTGQGDTISKFLRKELDKKLFKSRLDNLKVLTKKELTAKWEKAGASPDSDFVDMKVSDQFKKNNPQLSRDCGADILSYIQNTENPEVFNDLDFAADSLFCEWLYVVNLDTARLEVYKGFNKEPLTPKDRFYKLRGKKTMGGSEYHPVKLWKSILFTKLTAKTMVEFEKEDQKERDEEEANEV